MLLVWGLAVLVCVLGLLAPPPEGLHGGRGQQLLDLVRVAGTAGLAVTLLLGPGVVWRAGGGRIGLGFLPLPGLALLILTGGLAWGLAGTVEPRLICLAVLVPLLGLLLSCVLTPGPERIFDTEEKHALLIVGCALGFAIARSLWSLGPEGELYGGTIARTLEVGDRSDARISYTVVQLVAHGTAPFSTLGDYYFAPYDFSSRGPLPGLASAPVVLLAGGKPPLLLPDSPWQPFDQEGYMAYRVAMMSFATTAFLALWELVRRIGGWRASRIALLLAATTPFLVHEIWFTWPKLLASTFVLLAGLWVVERRSFRAGLSTGIGYLMHPGALLGISALGLLSLWPLKNPDWRRPRVGAALLLVAGTVVGLIAWRIVNGANYSQSGFFDYVQMAGNGVYGTPVDWLVFRAQSFGNTFVPMMLPLFFADNISINVFGGTSPREIHFFFQYWNGLPFGVGIAFFPLVLLSLWRAWRLWPWPIFAVVIVPLLAFTVYWGVFNSGMLREGLHVWVLVLLAVVALQQREAGFPWLRSTALRALLALRSVELLVVALGPTLVTTQILISPTFWVVDVVAVAAMLAFSMAMALLVWLTTPARLEAERDRPDHLPGTRATRMRQG